MRGPASGAAAGFWLAALGAIGFSFKAILIKLAYPYGVDAVTLLALRMLFSLPAFLFVAWREGVASRHPPLSRRDGAAVALLGVAGYYGASFLDFLGLQYISAGLERLILFVYPTLVVLISMLFLGKPISVREAAALALSYAGIALAFVHDAAADPGNPDLWLGAGLVFASSLAYAAYLIGNGQLGGRMGAGRFTAYALIWASAACILQFLLTRPLSALALPWQVYALSIAMAVFCTVAPVFMMSAAIRRIGAGRTGLISAIGPMATIFLGWLILEERLSLLQLGGALLVMAGVLLVSRR